MTKQNPYGQFAVYSLDKYQAHFPNAVPAARYVFLDNAKKHADSVTYAMVVVDTTAESSGFIYTNQGDCTGTQGESESISCPLLHSVDVSSVRGFARLPDRLQLRRVPHFHRRIVMQVTIEKNELVIRIPMVEPRPSASGKTLVVATTGGNQVTTAMVNGKPVTIGLNAYIKP